MQKYTADSRVGLYIANVLTFKRITTHFLILDCKHELDSILQMY